MPDDASATDRRSSTRAELEATRATFRDLVQPLSSEAWNRRSASSRRTVGQVCMHAISYLDRMLPVGVANARAHKNFPDMPGFVANPLNLLLSIMISRGSTPQSALASYDRAHAAALVLLEGIKVDEWPLSTRIPGGEFTVEGIFRHHTVHFREHEPEIRATLAAA